MKLKIVSKKRFVIAMSITAACTVSGIAYAAQASTAPAPGTCRATQPVYSDNDNKLIGTWNATLTAGQETVLPDEDVATCQKDGTLSIEQP